ncbi:MAG TPA: hypothetical protein VKH40_17175 [Alloacidobacterium sp.]|nr:hypothetical protein [Alloacidobacterium sp.]
MEQTRDRIPQQDRIDDPGVSSEFSLVRGGPFYRAQEATRLLTRERWNLGKRTIFAIVLAWIPLLLITLLSRPHAIGSLLTDYTINVRLFIAIPVLLAGQIIMENTFRTMVRHIREAELLSSQEQMKMDLTISSLIRLRDSIIPEIVIVAAAYIHFLTLVGSRVGTAGAWALSDSSTFFHLSPAGAYYALVSQVIYVFLLGISIWKWFLWICFLFRLSKLDLELVPTHPDQHGGIGFLGMSPMAIAPTVFVGTAAIGSTWRTEILKHTAHLMNFKIDAIVLLVIVLIVAMAPLVFFVPRLGRLRRRGILQYGILGQLHSVDFHKKWVLHRKGHEEEFLTAPEISTLTDYAASYENVEKLQPFPLDMGALLGLVLAIAIPMLPTVLAEIPFITVLKGLLAAVK